jgi:hypothetical protein
LQGYFSSVQKSLRERPVRTTTGDHQQLFGPGRLARVVSGVRSKWPLFSLKGHSRQSFEGFGGFLKEFASEFFAFFFWFDKIGFLHKMHQVLNIILF